MRVSSGISKNNIQMKYLCASNNDLNLKKIKTILTFQKASIDRAKRPVRLFYNKIKIHLLIFLVVTRPFV